MQGLLGNGQPTAMAAAARCLIFLLSIEMWRIAIMAGTIVIGGNLAKHTRVTLEIGPKGKKVVRWHLIGPGLSAGRRPQMMQSKGYVPIFRDIHRWQS
jgi:hypothetical protein